MIDNDWGVSAFPFVPGHEVVGVVAAKGTNVRGMEVSRGAHCSLRTTVGLGPVGVPVWLTTVVMSMVSQCAASEH